MNETVIKVEHLYKEYRLGVIRNDSLILDLKSWWARIRGKEDPNSLISCNPSGGINELKDNILALNDVSFEVKQGDLVGIIGSNGAGKSTLLKILSRITSPTKGEVKIRGRIASLLEIGTGFHPELTGKENVYLNGTILGMKKREIDKKIDEIIQFAEIEKFIDTPVKRYSSGMYVRLAFAVAAHLEPEILLVDEVLAVGDAQFQKKCLGKMSDVSKHGRTILFVSHNMGAIKQICDRCILFKKGELVDDGLPVSVIELYMKGSELLYNIIQKEFPEDLTKDFQLRSVKLLDKDRNITRDFECDEPVYIEFTCQVRRKLKGNSGYIMISKLDNTYVMEGDTYDEGCNPFENLSEGLYLVKITIPPRTLAPGEYTVYLAFGTKNIDIDMPGIVCSFHLDDFKTTRGKNRHGYFSTILNWNLSKIQEKI